MINTPLSPSSGRILAKEGHCWKLIFINSGMHRIIFAESLSFLYLIDCVIARLCFYLFLCIVGFAGFQGSHQSPVIGSKTHRILSVERFSLLYLI